MSDFEFLSDVLSTDSLEETRPAQPDLINMPDLFPIPPNPTSSSIVSLLEAAMSNPAERMALTSLMRQIVEKDEANNSPTVQNGDSFDLSSEEFGRFSTSSAVIGGSLIGQSCTSVTDSEMGDQSKSYFDSDSDSEPVFDYLNISSDNTDGNSGTLTENTSNVLSKRMADQLYHNSLPAKARTESTSRRIRRSCVKKTRKTNRRRDSSVYVEEIPRFPSCVNNMSLKFLQQPDKVYRARYATEGSRGCLKDDSQNSFPAVELSGFRGAELRLHVFVGSETGLPSCFYQITKTATKNTSYMGECVWHGTCVLDFALSPDCYDWIFRLDCIGIVRLRNTDVERRFGKKERKNNSTCCLVIRVTVPQPNNELLVLQTISSPISCAQPPGHPEIVYLVPKCALSLRGGDDLVIMGKNFTKNSKIIFFRTVSMDLAEFANSCESPILNITWRCTVPIDHDFSTAIHLLCRTPAYLADLSECRSSLVDVFVSVQCDGRCSDPFPFAYRKVGDVDYYGNNSQICDYKFPLFPMGDAMDYSTPSFPD